MSSPRFHSGQSLLLLLLIVISIVMLIPVVWLLAATLKSREDMFHYTFFAPHFSSRNIVDLFTRLPFLRYMANSMLVTGSIVLIQTLLSSMAGFALAKYTFPGKRLIMAMLLLSLMLPFQLLVVPLYQMTSWLGLMDSYLGLVIPYSVSIFGIFLFRQSMVQIPQDLLNAAHLDGCSDFRIYWNVVMPVTRPMTGAFCLISFMGAWNDFLWPQIILHNEQRFTLPIALNQLAGLYEAHEYGMLLAGTLVSVIPVAILFLFLQKEFVSGLMEGALKR